MCGNLQLVIFILAVCLAADISEAFGEQNQNTTSSNETAPTNHTPR